MIFENVKSVFLIISCSICSFNVITQVSAAGFLPVSAETNHYQIVFSEIMADPTPVIKLPGFEYLELYNRGIDSIDLRNWTITAGSYEILLPPAIIGPHEYVILCDFKHDSLFSSYGRTVPVHLPAILNTGQYLMLKTASGELIHSISFTDNWYHDHDKKNGGWSLEIIDPDNPCGGEDNWHASEDPCGGTPGFINSVKQENPDHIPPLLIRTSVPTDSSILLYFNEPLHVSAIPLCHQYSVNNSLFHPLKALCVEPGFDKILLQYHTRFIQQNIYSVSVMNTLQDCAKNQITGNLFLDFGISSAAESSDVIINEIMMHPDEDHAEFIELYNRSDHIIDMAEFTLTLNDVSSGEIKKSISFTDTPFMLLPGQYVAISDDAKNVTQNSYHKRPGVFLEIHGMFDLPNEEGLIVLNGTDNLIIDECYYHKSMHESLLRDDEGISLERVNPDLPATRENLHSSSATNGYATPGYKNSQSDLHENSWTITLVPEVFSPDGDGFDEMVAIQLALNEPGWICTIGIFNMQGHKVKSLAVNALLGTYETFFWNGLYEDGQPSPIGLYLLYGEMFTAKGKNRNFRKVITLVRK